MERLTDTHVTFVRELIEIKSPLICCRESDLPQFGEILDPYTEQVAIPLGLRLQQSELELCLNLARNFRVKIESSFPLEWSLFSVLSGHLYINGWLQLKKYWDPEFLGLFVNELGDSKLVKVVTQGPYGLSLDKLDKY